MTVKSFFMDISPLRDSPAFRYAFAARTATVLVTGMLLVAASLQLFQMTQSSVAVAALNVAMAVPMVLALVAGGVLSDQRDRRSLMLWSRSAYAVGVMLFFVNALLPEPSIVLIYVAGMISGAAGGISVPAMMAATPALVGRERLAAAAALGGLSMQIGGIVGPALAGALIAGPGLVFCYGIVLVGVLTTPFLLYRLPPLPPPPRKAPVRAAASFIEGLSYIRGNPLLRGLLLIDLAAMVLATPLALLPEWGTRILGGGPQVAGFLYAAPAIGATLAALSSGWTRRVTQTGHVLIAAVLVWGASIVLLALGTSLWWAMISLALMGAADTISKILRGALMQRHTPDALLGRVSSIWMMQTSIGPALGNVQVGFVARLLSPPLALLIGGVACVAAVSAVAATSPSLRAAQLQGTRKPGEASADAAASTTAPAQAMAVDPRPIRGASSTAASAGESGAARSFREEKTP